MKKNLLVVLLLFSGFMLSGQINFIHQDTVFTQTNNCNGGILMCVDSINYDKIDSLKFFLDGNTFNTNFSACKTDTVYAYSYFYLKSQPIPFTLQSWDLNGIKHTINFSSLTTLRDSMRVWDAPTDWKVDTAAYLIYFSNASPRIYNPQIITSSNGTNVYTSKINTGEYYHGLRFRVNPGFHKFIVQRTSDNQRDTVILGAACVMPNIVRRTLVMDSSSSFCADISQLLGQASSIINYCSKTLNTSTLHVQFQNPQDNCIRFKALKAGSDTACLKFCDRFGICDTTILIITAVANAKTSVNIRLTDSVMVDSVKTRCDVQLPDGIIKSFSNICAGTSTHVAFTLDSTRRCVSFKGITVGTDSICIQTCNGTVCDTTFLIVNASKKIIISTGHTFQDTVSLNTTRKKILPGLQPVGMITRFENLCAGKSGTYVQFSLDSIFNGIYYKGIKPGKDTACILTCNTQGICDTTFFYITTLNSLITNSDTVKIKITQNYTYCPDSSKLAGSPLSGIAFCQLTSPTHVDIHFDTNTKCVLLRGSIVGSDTFCIVLKNKAGFTYTTKLFVFVSSDTVKTHTVFDTVSVIVGDSVRYCKFDSSGIKGKITRIFNNCPAQSGLSSQINLDTVTNCLLIRGLFAGTDKACIIGCNRVSGLCDTTQLFVLINPKIPIGGTGQIFIDSVILKISEQKTYCSDTTKYKKLSLCSSLPSAISYSLSAQCVTVVGKKAGKDSLCTIACKANGVCDTFKVYTTVTADTVLPQTRTDIINLKIGKDSLYCSVDTSQIRGSADTIYDACPQKNGTKARMVLDRSTKCVAVKAVNVGSDTMCLVVCNKLSKLCDTTFVVVNVIDTARTVVTPTVVKANNDFDSLRLGTSKDIYVYSNDSLGGKTPTRLTVILPPTKGKADTISFRDGIIKYTADSSLRSCGIDSFRYRVCVDTVCSEATVTILVICSDTLKVYNAISPNGDGVNDVLVIDGLQNYPNHTLCIYSRWGNEVFKTTNYNNDWGGTWNGKGLPDGIYFYFLRNDDDKQILKTGYINIAH